MVGCEHNFSSEWILEFTMILNSSFSKRIPVRSQLSSVSSNDELYVSSLSRNTGLLRKRLERPFSFSIPLYTVQPFTVQPFTKLQNTLRHSKKTQSGILYFLSPSIKVSLITCLILAPSVRNQTLNTDE